MIYSKTIGEGPDMVCLHGWGMHSEIWPLELQTLASNYRITYIDLPGLGKSIFTSTDKTFNWHICIATIVENTPKTAIWLGWSLGGFIAQWIAIFHPDKVVKLILVSTTPKWVGGEGWPGIDVEQFTALRDSLEKNVIKTLNDFLTLQCFGNTIDKISIKIIKNIIFKFGIPSINSLKGYLNVLFNIDLRKMMLDIKCPVLFICGENDRIVPIDVVNNINGILKNSTIVIIREAGHIPFISHPLHFIKVVKNFLLQYNKNKLLSPPHPIPLPQEGEGTTTVLASS